MTSTICENEVHDMLDSTNHEENISREIESMLDDESFLSFLLKQKGGRPRLSGTILKLTFFVFLTEVPSYN